MEFAFSKLPNRGYSVAMKHGLLLMVSALFLAALTGCQLRGEKADNSDENGLLPAEVATIGMDYLSQSPVVLIRSTGDGRTVPIWIGFAEAQAIARALHDVDMPRPMTHDLALSLVKEAGAAVEEVHIIGLRNGIFYATIQMRVSGREERAHVDSRPSDAIALALRSDARILVHTDVLEASPDYHFVPPEAEEQVVQILGMTVVTLTDELRQRHGLPDDAAGVIVSSATGKAREKGLRPGDQVERVNDQTVTTPMEVLEAILEVEPGQEVDLHILRGGEKRTISLPVEETAEPERERIMI